MFYTDNPIADFGRYDREQAEQLEQLPVCDHCGEPIQDEHYYHIYGENICTGCMESQFRKETDFGF